MDILDVMYKRRSIRDFLDKPVDKETILMLVKAAMAAPTAANNQPWEFIIVDEKERLDEMKKSLIFARYNAPVAIVVCGNMDLAFSGPCTDYWIQDCSAAMENILITATGIGLGSIWIGVYPLPSNIKAVRKALNIPEQVIPLGIALIGHSAEEKEPRTQYNEKRVYWQMYEPERKHRARPKNLKHL